MSILNNRNKDEYPVFSGLDALPDGKASDKLINACLVLEGGAFRGVYTSGVLDALMENDINCSCVVGVSAGAMNGANYVAGQIGRSGRINLRFRHDSRYVGSEAFKNNAGVIGFDFVLGDEVEKTYPFDHERFERPEQRFIAVATDTITGRDTYFEKGKCSDIFKGIQASASMPYISKPVEIDGRTYLDGGCSCCVPFRFALIENYEKIIIVRTRPTDYRDEPKPQAAMSATEFMYSDTRFADLLAHSNDIYDSDCDAMEALTKAGRVYTIAPVLPIEIGRLEPDMEKLGELYYRGYNDALHRMKGIKKYLEIDE